MIKEGNWNLGYLVIAIICMLRMQGWCQAQQPIEYHCMQHPLT